MSVLKTWPERIKARMKELNLTQEELANKMGITRAAVTHYLAGRRVPPLKQFERLANILKTDVPWLYLGSSLENPTDIKNEALVPTHFPIPLLEWELVAQFPDLTKIKQEKFSEWVPRFHIDKTPTFGLRIENDSMISPSGHNKSFHPGDIIIIDPNAIAQHGKFVVAVLPKAKEATFKQYVVDGGIRYLKPLNPQYPTVQIDDKTRICGVMVNYIG